MSTTAITSVLKTIRDLPADQRTSAATRIVRELTPDTLESKIESSVNSGHFTALYGQAMLDYAQGRALDRLD